MRVYGSRDVVGLWVLDERGRVLGEVVGLVHHWNGRSTALVHGGSWRSGTGRLVSLDGAVVVDGDIHLHRGIPRQEPGVVERHTGDAHLSRR